MKVKILLISFFLILTTGCFGQFYKAGDTFSGYLDINPDTLINYFGTQASNSESYYIDINGDQQNDILVHAKNSNTSVSGTQEIYLKTLNQNTFIRLSRLDSVWVYYYSFWWVDKVALPLQFSDTINSPNSNWDSSYLFLSDVSHNVGAWKNVQDWVGPNDEYIGLKFENTIDTIYGWIRVNCSTTNKCLIKDYSFAPSTLGIDEIKTNNFSVYPNPSSDKIYIKQKNAAPLEINIVDVFGKILIPSIKNENQQTEIDVSTLENGIYFLQIKTPEGISSKKIIIRK